MRESQDVDNGSVNGSDDENEVVTTKRLKTNNNQAAKTKVARERHRPRLKDKEGSEKRLLHAAMNRFRVYICTQFPFASAIEEANLADDAWHDTCLDENVKLDIDGEMRTTVRGNNIYIYRLINSVMQILCGTSNIRGSIRNKIRGFVKQYGFKACSAKDDAKVQENQKLYKHLREDRNFLFRKSYLNVCIILLIIICS